MSEEALPVSNEPRFARPERISGRRPTIALVAAIFAFGASMSTSAEAQDLMTLLRAGPVVSVEQSESGAFERCTAVVFIRAQPEQVWSVLVDFDRYTEFMPKLVGAEVRERSETSATVALELDTPVRNTRYVMAYELRRDSWEVRVRWVSGDLRDTFGDWRLVATRGGTLAYYTGATRNYSRMLQALEDDQQTITIGVNVSSAIAQVRAIKDRTESLFSPPSKPESR